MTEISPAILTNDISDFRKKYAELFALSHYFTKLHIDFADGKFVDNKTVMPKDLPFLKSSTMTLMAHFMTLEPHKYFEDAKNVGFSYVLFHFEAYEEESLIAEAVDLAKKLNLKVGIVLNPETPLHKLGKFLQKIDAVQLMGIHPGFQGRKFMPEILDKIQQLRALTKNVIIIIDGGVKVGIAHQLAKHNADILVVGSAITEAKNMQSAVEQLTADIETK